MSDPAIKVGDKLHIITRRRFENDVRRHFVGEVTAIFGELQEIRGYAFVFEPGINVYRKPRSSGRDSSRSAKTASLSPRSLPGSMWHRSNIVC